MVEKIIESKIIREFTRMQMLGPNMPYLFMMYNFWIFLFNYLSLMSHDDKPIVPTYLPNAFTKIQ